MAKRRLDQRLLDDGAFPSKARAAAAIMAGLVRVNGEAANKAGQAVSDEAQVSVVGEVHPYVSRGGLKLAHALEAFGIDPAGKRCLDAGASTGGFTDVLLRGGAVGVLAVDVGYGQLAWSLRQDERVVVMERTNVRHIEPESLPWRPELIVGDLSFIGLAKVLPALAACLVEGGEAVLLVKPQFELGKGRTDGGVVKDPADHLEALQGVADAAPSVGWALVGAAVSPIRGPEGNVEFLARFRAQSEGPALNLKAVVALAHRKAQPSEESPEGHA